MNMVENPCVECQGLESRACFAESGVIRASFHLALRKVRNLGWVFSRVQISRDNAAMVGTRQMQLRPRPEDIAKLKIPLGRLLTGKPEEAIPKLLRLIERENPPKVVTVGDVVSRETWKSGLRVGLRIIDQRSMRRRMPKASLSAKTTYHVRNPAGVVTMEAWKAIQDAMREKEVVMIVEGEEDLLTLPAIVESPDDAFVVYGQPSQGLVVVTATAPKKRKILEMMNAMHVRR